VISLGKVNQRKRLLFISGSYPEYQGGIAAGAKILLDEMIEQSHREKFVLLTTDIPIIKNSIKENSLAEYVLMPDWKNSLTNIMRFFSVIRNYSITSIHMEYPGNVYGKTFLATFLPFYIRIKNCFSKNKIMFCVRLHEFSQARFLRKLAIIPIILFADKIYIPAEHDRELAQRIGGKKVLSTVIGTNINVAVDLQKDNVNDVPVISYFGAVYHGKGIEKTLELWVKIKKLLGDKPVIFKIIGDVGTEDTNHFQEYHKYVLKKINESGIQDCINITGYLPDDKVSGELYQSDAATMLYEDGLTLRRGSFIAYLTHGVPIITTMPDKEAEKVIAGAEGVYAGDDIDKMAAKAVEYLNMNLKQRRLIKKKNTEMAAYFSWEEIAKRFDKDYGLMD